MRRISVENLGMAISYKLCRFLGNNMLVYQGCLKCITMWPIVTHITKLKTSCVTFQLPVSCEVMKVAR